MKWSKKSIVVVLAILSISYFYSSFQRNKLSNEIKRKELENCSKNENYDCNLINNYHDECFNTAYRSEYKIRSFHTDAYRTCLSKKIGH